MSNIKNVVPFLLFGIAIIQLIAIGEKLTHAFWQGYKFYGSGRPGGTSFSAEMFWFTVLASVIGILISSFLSSRLDSKFSSAIVKLSRIFFSIGLSVLVILIVSPLGQFM